MKINVVVNVKKGVMQVWNGCSKKNVHGVD
jgi:hypothetical protein